MPNTIRSEHKAVNRSFLLQSFMGVDAEHQSYRSFLEGNPLSCKQPLGRTAQP